MGIKVETGYGKGAYELRYKFEDNEMERAQMHYDGINTHSGYKKRLVGPDGKVIARYISTGTRW